MLQCSTGGSIVCHVENGNITKSTRATIDTRSGCSDLNLEIVKSHGTIRAHWSLLADDPPLLSPSLSQL